MRKIYFVSGLGADERIFQLLSLPESYNCTYIQWLVPYRKETVTQYVNRLKVQINPAEKYVLIGVSFGGVVAQELAKVLKPEKTIIISSIARSADLPVYLRIAGKLHLHTIIPASLLKHVNFLTYYLFGVKSNDQKSLLRSIIEDTDEKFLKWAIHQILTWQAEKSIANLIHIHGTADKILPLHDADEVIKIKGGGHLMILTHAAAIREIIHELLNSGDEAS